MPAQETPYVQPPDHNERMAQARARAQWELGDPSWADIIMRAYMHPLRDKESLDQEKGS